MPTLNEFIKKTMIENNLAFNASDVEKYIEKEAKKMAGGIKSCVAISDEDVRKMIIEFKAEPKAESKKETKKESKECQEDEKQLQTQLF